MMTDEESVVREYDEVCREWIEHEEIREDVLDMVTWWISRDDTLRKTVAHYANEMYKLRRE